jgi:transcriptional regulator with XRE-family HTH domain
MPYSRQAITGSVARAMALNKDQFAEQLLHHRSLAGLNQADVAEQVGVDLRTYQRWEAAERMPYKRHLRRLSEVLDVDPEVFTGSLETSDTLLRLEQAVNDNNRLLRQLYALIATTMRPADGVPEAPQGALARELQETATTGAAPRRAQTRAARGAS